MKKINLALVILLGCFFLFSCTKKITEPQYPKKVFIFISGKVTLQIFDPYDPWPHPHIPPNYSNTQVNIFSVSMFAKDTVKEFTAVTDSLGNFSSQFELKVGRRVFIRPQREEYLPWPPYPNEVWLGIAENSTGYPLSKGGYFNVLSDTMVNFKVFGDTVRFDVKEWRLDDYFIHFGLLKGGCYVRRNISPS